MKLGSLIGLRPTPSTPEMIPLVTSGRPEIEFDLGCKGVSKYVCATTARPICDIFAVLICCRPEVAGDVISVENVKTIEGYAVFKF